MRKIFSKWICIMSAMLIFMGTSTTSLAKTELDVPEEVRECAAKEAEKYSNINEELIEAICFYESSYISTVYNGSCKGLMQVNITIHGDILEEENVTDIYNIEQNIRAGCRVLDDCIKDQNDIYLALMQYNGDSKGMQRYKETGKVSNYANKVIELRGRLEILHGKEYEHDWPTE